MIKKLWELAEDKKKNPSPEEKKAETWFSHTFFEEGQEKGRGLASPRLQGPAYAEKPGEALANSLARTSRLMWPGNQSCTIDVKGEEKRNLPARRS